MNVFAPWIRRPAGTSLLGIGLLIAGVWAYLLLGVAALPAMDIPAVFVTAQMPGASAETIANTVMAPLERHLGRVPAVKQMAGIANEGSVQVQMLFEFGTNTDAAARDVQQAINSAARDLPPGMPVPPQYFKLDTTQLPVVLIALSSPSMPADRLYDLADTLAKPAISQVEGVSSVQVSGGSAHAVRVELDTLALAAKGMSTGDISNALIAANVTSALGSLQAGHQQMMLLANDSLTSPAEFAHIIVGVRNGTPVRLSDIATISNGQEDEYQAAWLNGQRSVVLQVSKRPEANAVATVDAIKARMPGLRALFPADTQITPIFDLTQTTKTALHEVEVTLGISVLMVAGVMLLFLRRVGPMLIAMVSVPLSLAGAFGVMWMLGYSLNTLSLVALVLAIGFVVDDAIVVIENIVRHMELGEEPLDAALIGTREIGFTVVSITLSLIAVFAPMVFGNNMFVSLVHEFSVTLVAAIVVSAIVSLTITPALCGRYLVHQPETATHGMAAALARWDERILGHYERLLRWSMHHRRLMRWQPALLLVLT
ncbi:MAG: efflux RND transporter permease subunit, partial [Luteibacter sp.]